MLNSLYKITNKKIIYFLYTAIIHTRSYYSDLKEKYACNERYLLRSANDKIKL